MQLVHASQDLERPGHGSPASGARTPSYPAGAAADVERGSGSLMQQVQLLESVLALDLQGQVRLRKRGSQQGWHKVQALKVVPLCVPILPQAAHDIEAKMAPLRRTSHALREALNRSSPTRPGPST